MCPTDSTGLYDTSTVLVTLVCKYHGPWSHGRSTNTTFAARVKTETAKLFVHTLDGVCRDMAGRMLHTQGIIKPDKDNGTHVLQYEYTSRRFVWQGIENGNVSIAGLSDNAIQDQLEMMAKRGHRDHVVVEMQVASRE